MNDLKEISGIEYTLLMPFITFPTKRGINCKSKDGRFEALEMSLLGLAWPFITLGCLCLKIVDFAKSIFSKKEVNDETGNKPPLSIKKAGIAVLSGIGGVIFSPLALVSLTIRGLLGFLIHPKIILEHKAN